MGWLKSGGFRTVGKLYKERKNRKIFPLFVIPKRFERLTHALEGRCSIQLSYGTYLFMQNMGITSFAFAKIVRFFRCAKYFLAFFCFNGKMVVKESDFLFKIPDHRTQVMHCNTATVQGQVTGLLHLVE